MLGSFLLPYHTKRSSRLNIRRVSCSFDRATSFGIVCSYHSLISGQAIVDLLESLKEKGKKVSLLVFYKDAAKTEDLMTNSFSKKDLNFFGYWKNEKVTTFIQKEFDFLLHMDLTYNPFISNIIAKSRAHCRIGIYHEESKPFLELMIKPENQSLSALSNEIHQVLARIRNDD